MYQRYLLVEHRIFTEGKNKLKKKNFKQENLELYPQEQVKAAWINNSKS